MKSLCVQIISFVLSLVLAVTQADKKIFCYIGTWAVYRPGRGRFDIDHVNPHLCTHLIYSFFGINEDGTVRIIDPYLDLEENWGRGHIKRFNALKSVNRALKTLAAIGGWNEGSRKFSKVAASPALRKRFIQDCVDFCRAHNFDGIDLDWEYPGQRFGDAKVDKDNYVAWLEEFRTRFDQEGLIISAAVASAQFSAEQSYNIPRVAAALHYINVMAYDMHGAWDDYIGLNAPLYRGSADVTDVQKQLNVNTSVHYWLSQGAPREKIILGVPLYGRSFTLANAAINHIGAAASGPGIAGPYSREPGVMGYNEFCELRQTDQWSIHESAEQRGLYAIKGNQWLGFDDATTIQYKMDYLLNMGLGGVMVWSLETDDFLGICHKKSNILMNTIYTALNEGLEAPTVPTTTTTSTTAGPNDCTVEGMFPNAESCTKYYICTADGLRYDFSCPAGLFFDPVNKICNWPDQVNCNAQYEDINEQFEYINYT